MDDAIEELVQRNDRTISALVDMRDKLDSIIRENKRESLRLKRKLAEEGLIESDGWRTMDEKERIDFVRSAILEYEESTEEGAPREYVVEIVSGITDAPKASVENVVNQLRKRGEVYEPVADHLRTT